MNTYNTRNQLGPTSPKDLYDNASNFDEAMNSTGPAFVDRFGKRRETWQGMQNIVTDFLAQMGFEATHLIYTDGSPLVVSRPTQLIDRAGSVYKVKQPATFPVTLSGTWATDQSLLVDVGDMALRLDLANASDPSKGASMIGYRLDATGAVNQDVYTKLAGSPLTPQDFGAPADGAADDTLFIQKMLDFAGAKPGRQVKFDGKYRISTGLTYQPTTPLDAALPGSDLHFSDHVESVIWGSGNSVITATVAMPTMLTLKFNAGISAIGPFYTTVTGLTLDGADLAVDGIKSNYTMNVSLLKNKIHGVANGISYTGYGVAKIRDNVIKASANCINFSGGGGDSDLSSNDFYPLAGAVCIRIGALGGNASVSKNVCNGEGFAGCIGVYLDGVNAGASNSVINIRIYDNEFSGMTYDIYGKRHPSVRNVFGVTIWGNHNIPAAGGAVHTGQLVSLEGVDDVNIFCNQINGMSLAATITNSPGLSFVDCRRLKAHNNKFGNLLGPAAYFRDCIIAEFSNNEMLDTGMAGAGGVVVDVDNGTTYLLALDNTIRQSSPSFAQNPFYERAGANGNEFLRNHIFGCANRITRVGSSSVVSGRVVAQGSCSLAGGAASLQGNSHGYTVTFGGVGIAIHTLATGRPDADFRVNATADVPQVQVDTKTPNSFTVRTFTAAGAPVNANSIQIEVID